MEVCNEGPNILYHYCNIDTFMKIVENKTIRLSNIFKMNDYSEVKFILDSLEYALSLAYRESPFDFTYKGKENESAFSEIVLDIKKNIDAIIYIPYIACFSENGDDLGQWRAYGDDGRGVSIGFDRKVLADIVNKFSKKNSSYFTLEMTKASYSNEDQLEFMRDTITGSVFRGLKNAKENPNVKNGLCSFENMVITIIIHDAAAILMAASKYKSGYFQNECEWRICLTTFINETYYEDCADFSKDIIRGDYTLKKMQFRNNGSQLISYMDLCFSNNLSGIIKNIVAGPRSDINDTDLKMFFMMNGLNSLSIRSSEIPYKGK